MARALTPAELAELVRLTQERNEALARGEDLLADQKDRLKELQQIDEERMRLSSAEIQRAENQIAQLEAVNQLRRDAIDLMRAAGDTASNQKNIEAELQSIKAREAEMLRIRRETDEDILQQMINQLQTLGDISDEFLDLNPRAKELMASTEGNREEIEKALDATKGLVKAGKENQQLLTQETPQYSKIYGNMLRIVDLAQQGNLLEAAKAKLMQQGDNLLEKIYDRAISQIFELDKAQSEFNKEFRFGPEYTDRIKETTKSLNQYGVSIQDAAKAQTALVRTFTDFTMLNETAQDQLVESAALAAELGVANQDFAQGIQNATKFMAQTSGQAAISMRELAATAQALGVSQAKMAQDFAAAGPQLAKFGDMGVQVFKELAVVSKTTGLEIGKVLSLVEKFDTFEGAAKQAGKLNAALGGNFVNAMDLMMATNPAERFNMIRDSILDAGLSFDDMSYYQKNFYKDALGLSDVGELAMMLSGNMDDLGGATEASAEDLIAQKEAAAQVQSITDKLSAIVSDNAEIFLGLATALQFVASLLLDNYAIVSILIGGYALYRAVLMAATLAQSLQTLGVITSTTAFSANGIAAAAATAMQKTFQLVLLAGTAIFKGITIVVGLFSAALRFLVPSLASVLPASTGAAAGTSIFAAAAAAGVGPILALGAAGLMLGGGIALAALGVAQLVLALGTLQPEQFIMLATGMGFFTVTLLGLAAGALIAGVNFAAALPTTLGFAAAMMMLGIAINLAASGISTLVESLSTSFASMTESISVLANLPDGLDPVAEQIERISEAVESMPFAKTILFKTMLDSAAVGAVALGNAVSPVGGAGGGGAFATAGGGGAVAGENTTMQPIDINIDGEKIKRLIVKVIGNQRAIQVSQES